MSTVTMPRHALGLPGGSVRALLLVMVVGLLCSILLLPPLESGPIPIPPYLIYLLFIMLGHYFGARSTSLPGEAPPLYLPRGSVRLLVILALAGTIGWKFYNDPDGLKLSFEGSLNEVKNQPYLPIVILCAFLVGTILRTILGRGYRPRFFQDFEAWVSLLGTLGLAAEVIIRLVIMPSLANATSWPTWEACLAGIIAFYFGERS